MDTVQPILVFCTVLSVLSVAPLSRLTYDRHRDTHAAEMEVSVERERNLRTQHVGAATGEIIDFRYSITDVHLYSEKKTNK